MNSAFLTKLGLQNFDLGYLLIFAAVLTVIMIVVLIVLLMTISKVKKMKSMNSSKITGI